MGGAQTIPTIYIKFRVMGHKRESKYEEQKSNLKDAAMSIVYSHGNEKKEIKMKINDIFYGSEPFDVTLASVSLEIDWRQGVQNIFMIKLSPEFDYYSSKG